MTVTTNVKTPVSYYLSARQMIELGGIKMDAGGGEQNLTLNSHLLELYAC